MDVICEGFESILSTNPDFDCCCFLASVLFKACDDKAKDSKKGRKNHSQKAKTNPGNFGSSHLIHLPALRTTHAEGTPPPPEKQWMGISHFDCCRQKEQYSLVRNKNNSISHFLLDPLWPIYVCILYIFHISYGFAWEGSSSSEGEITVNLFCCLKIFSHDFFSENARQFQPALCVQITYMMP